MLPVGGGGNLLLALSVISHQSRRLGASSYRVFDERGGSIGRGEDNDWILEDPDSLLSSRHAIVRANKGTFLIVDVSTNGTGLNNPDSLVPHGHGVPLSEGDRLFLGDFEILVQVIAQTELAPSPSGAKNATGAVLAEEPSPFSALPEDLPAPATEIAQKSILPVSDATPPLESPPDRSAQPAAESVVGLGQGPPEVNTAVEVDLNDILHVATQGLIDALGTRAAIKNQFRMALTYVRPQENNPLKFTDSATDALRTLLEERNPAYLGPIEAFSQAVDDLAHHQTAMLEGMRAAYLAVLRRFDPERIEAECDSAGAHPGVFSRLTRRRYWPHYRALYASLTHDSDTAYLEVFGEAFARAYDEKIRHLEDARLNEESMSG
jgi:type VI secretion system protein ImpI